VVRVDAAGRGELIDKPVIFFDGVCGLCNRFVDFVIRRDRRRVFLFAPLQTESATRLLPGALAGSEDTVVVLQGGGVLVKSAAVLRILELMGLPWSALSVFRIVPGAILDRVYDAVARRRYSVFGKREVCRVPTPDERSRFL
jgi:predicted DCC family thiol-disulfide oxidoreductase YuxK